MTREKRKNIKKQINYLNTSALVLYTLSALLITCILILDLSGISIPMYFSFFVIIFAIAATFDLNISKRKIDALKKEKVRLRRKRGRYWGEKIFEEYLNGNIEEAQKIFIFVRQNELIKDFILRSYFVGLLSAYSDDLIRNEGMRLLDNIYYENET